MQLEDLGCCTQINVLPVYISLSMRATHYCTPTLPYPTLPYLTLPYPTIPYPTLPYPTLPHPTLPNYTRRCTDHRPRLRRSSAEVARTRYWA